MGIFDKIKDKKDNFKVKQVTKFRNQSYASYKQTESDSEIYKKAVDKVDNLSDKVFCYNFKRPYHQKLIVSMKKINFWLLFSYTVVATLCCVLFGLMLLTPQVNEAQFWDKEHIHFDYDSYHNANVTSWLANFLPQIIVLGLLVIYLFFYVFYLFKKNKKYNSDQNYLYTFNLNIVLFIILLLVFITTLPSYIPFNLLIVTIFQTLSYTSSVANKVLIVFSGVCDILLILSLLGYISTSVICLIINPKFDKSKLNI